MEQNTPEVIAVALAWQAHLDELSKCLQHQMEEQKRFIQTFLVGSPTMLPKFAELPDIAEVSQPGGSPLAMRAPSSRQTSDSHAGTERLRAESMQLQMIQYIEESNRPTLCGAAISAVYSWAESAATVTASDHRVLGAKWAAWLVQTRVWDLFFILLIILNVVWFSFVADASMQEALQTYDGHTTDEISSWVVVVDGVFLLLFVIELVVRILAVSASGEMMHRDLRYFLVDRFIVLVSALEIVFTHGSKTSSFIRNLRLLKLVRFCELQHHLKHIGFFGKFVRIMSACVHSAEDLFWGSMLLFVGSATFAVLFLQFVTECVAEATAHDEVVDQLRPYFSSIRRSILTSLMCVLGGVSWWEVEQHFLEISWFLSGLFMIFIFTMLVAVLNVVTGVFVTEAVGRADADREVAAALRNAKRDALRAKLISIFKDVDIDNSGEVTSEELDEMLERDDIQALLSLVGIESLDHMRFFHALDVDGSGSVSLDGFLLGVSALAGQSKQVDLIIFHSEMKTMLDALDEKHNQMAMFHSGSSKNDGRHAKNIKCWLWKLWGPSPTNSPSMRCVFERGKCVAEV